MSFGSVPDGLNATRSRQPFDSPSAIIKSPDVVEKINQQGGEVIATGPERFAAFLPKDTAQWAKLIKDANVKVE